MKPWSAPLSSLGYGLRSAAVRRSLWVLLATGLGCLLLALIWWLPLQGEQRELARQLDTRRLAVVRAERLRLALQAQAHVLPQLTALEQKLRARAAQADLVQGIARLAARRGVRVVSQSFDEGRPQPGASTQPLYLELGLAGDYAALRRFTGDLADLPVWIEIVEERLESAGRGATLQAQLRLLTYRNLREAQP